MNRRLRLRRLLLALTYLSIAGLATVVVGQFSGFPQVTPITQLLAFFQYALPAAFVLAVMTAGLRSWWAFGASALIFGIVAIVLWPTGPELASAVAPGAKLRVVSANVLEGQATAAVLDNVLSDPTPTAILALVECSPECAAAIDTVRAREAFPYRIANVQPGAIGAAVLSRTPVRWDRAATDADSEAIHGLAPVVVEVSGSQISLRVAHPMLPWPGTVSQWHDDLADLADYARTATPPVIIAGDFNATRFHRPFRNILAAGDLWDASARIGGTWPGRLPPLLSSQIDHILVSNEFNVVASGSEYVFGSDHRTIYTDLVLAPTPRR